MMKVTCIEDRAGFVLGNTYLAAPAYHRALDSDVRRKHYVVRLKEDECIAFSIRSFKRYFERCVVSKYGLGEIATKLNKTALNEAYHGNELYVARDLPFLGQADKECLSRYIEGTQTSTDHILLQDIAMRLFRESAITEFYTDRNDSGQAALAK